MSARALTMAFIVVLAAGCASHQAPKPIGDAATPRIGWVIMHGSTDNPDEEFACQSNPRDLCVLPASTPQRRVFSQVHLYFHPIGTALKYDGTMQIGFLGEGRATPLAIAVDAKNIANSSIVGIVTDKPGEYALQVSATAATDKGQMRVTENVAVTVR